MENSTRPKPRPLKCSMNEARDLCIRIAEHVDGLTDASTAILDAEDEGQLDLLRSSYILTLMALEEIGKMADLRQAASRCDASDLAVVVEVDGFRDHDVKGRLMGDLCCQMFEYAERNLYPKVLREHPELKLHEYEATKPLKDARSQLLDLSNKFRTERLSAIYVDLHAGKRPSRYSVVMYNLLMGFISMMVRAYFRSGETSFVLASDALRKIDMDTNDEQTAKFREKIALGLSLMADDLLTKAEESSDDKTTW